MVGWMDKQLTKSVRIALQNQQPLQRTPNRAARMKEQSVQRWCGHAVQQSVLDEALEEERVRSARIANTHSKLALRRRNIARITTYRFSRRFISSRIAASLTRMSPPPKDVAVLMVPKLNMDTSARASPVYCVMPANACAQSSTTSRSWALATSRTPSSENVEPKMCATRISRVF